MIDGIRRSRRASEREFERMQRSCDRTEKLAFGASAAEYAEIGAGLALQAARSGLANEMVTYRYVTRDRVKIPLRAPALLLEARKLADIIIAAGRACAALTD
jgi:hypothetical protein